MEKTTRPTFYAFGLALLFFVFSIYSSSLILLCIGSGINLFSWVLAPLIFSGCLFWIKKTYKQSFLKLAAFTTFVFFVTAFISGKILDTSWDGQAYHYDAIQQLIHGWNPLRFVTEDEGRQILGVHVRALLYYAKLPWIYVASVAQLFGNQIEAGKNLQSILIISLAFMSVGKFIKKPFQILEGVLWLLLILSPVFITQTLTFYCDGILGITLAISFLFILEMLKSGVARELIIPAAISIIISVNVKNFSVVYLLIGLAVLSLIFLKESSQRVIHVLKFSVVVIPVALFIFGFSPYANNVRSRNFPLYPIQPSWLIKHIPEIGQQLSPSLETQTRFVKFAVSLFGKSSGAFPNDHLGIKIPFRLYRGEANGAGYYDARSGGFGPLFSGIFLLSIFFAIKLAWKNTHIRLTLVYIFAGCIVMVAVNPESWWARWSPQVWWLPWVIFLLYIPRSTAVERKIFTAIAILGVLNLGIVSFGWGKRIWIEQREFETKMSELAEHSGKFQIIFGYNNSVRFRLMERGIAFNNVQPPIRCGREKRFFPNSDVRYCLNRDMTQ